ncbi:T-cell ecto-ADP-ribosyltransferase 2 [Sinocyclocheilus anshuiensis]|uniref:NAD(P)(+)--arginine ADP-ribosyltransferase n=1 Tax=Sinocyclocheilus anshuiensis TaxID=1608454 RepID=A0A671MEY5_9TELE|nr:PREDICTED: T-cell ecto-ADP-ribosyltransferase 2-like [Sinocyclocheilus anshuiensis]XP_016357375.1 PREDICTED: T-cell ecto-ADP-ribosyltransferase 2-like [Sinocyclocheilus anshuiensis]
MGSLRFHAFLLLLLYTSVVQITEEVIHMGLFPEAADYSFYNCRKEMLQMVTKSGGLLQTELNNNADFKTMWRNATSKKAIPGSTPEHMAALQSYVEATPEFHEKFKKLVQNNGRGSSTSQDEFPFKSLFFLLTDAMQLEGQKKCRTVYSGTEKEYSTKIGEKVRFASFFPAKLQYTSATEDASVDENPGTVFNITSCSVISLEDYGCSSEEMDALISPTDVFTVEDITTVMNINDEFKKITLVHSHFYSSYNCSGLASLSEESKESSSSFPSSSFLNLMASFLMLCFYTLIL